MSQVQILGPAEVPKPPNCRCKNANWFVLKNESHHNEQYNGGSCICCSICNSDIVAVKQCRLLNPCKPSNEDIRSFYGNFVNATFKSVRPDDDYYVCKKDFQLLEKAMKARNTYQAIVCEMKLAIGVTIDVSTKEIYDSLSKSNMSIGDMESSSLSAISKLPEGEASPSVTNEPNRTTAVSNCATSDEESETEEVLICTQSQDETQPSTPHGDRSPPSPPSPLSIPEHSHQAVPTPAVTPVAPSYILVGDNWDKNIRPRRMTMDHQTTSSTFPCLCNTGLSRLHRFI